jgi:hypothetical protein
MTKKELSEYNITKSEDEFKRIRNDLDSFVRIFYFILFLFNCLIIKIKISIY